MEMIVFGVLFVSALAVVVQAIVISWVIRRFYRSQVDIRRTSLIASTLGFLSQVIVGVAFISIGRWLGR